MEEYKHILKVSPGKQIEVDANQAWNDFNNQHFTQKGSITNKKQQKVNTNDSFGSDNFRNRRLRSCKLVAYSSVAAAVVLLAFAFVFNYYVGYTTSDIYPELVNQEITTEKGQRTTVRLSDGTRIHLNSESQLSVAGNYNTSPNRVIYLEGEAFFEVVSSKDRPFEVKTAGSVISVLGTKFNVTTYPEDEEVQVVVSEGKVALGSDEGSKAPGVQLSRNQKGTISLDGEITASRVSDIEIYLDWSKGRLTFQDASVQEVATRLGRWFDIDVTIAEGVATQNRLLTGSFEDVPLPSVIQSIALSLDMEYQREGRTVIFKER